MRQTQTGRHLRLLAGVFKPGDLHLYYDSVRGKAPLRPAINGRGYLL